jgi:hypothetical protein
MAFQSFTNLQGVLLSPWPTSPEFLTSLSSTTIDAAGESGAAVGRMLLSSGPGTSKTISSAGGKVFFRAGAVTFANAGTTIRVGIQDVAATGLEDGTYDVRGDLVGGTDTITANAIKAVSMSTGSKSITHGDRVAVVIEAISRSGADSLVVNRSSTSSSLPYSTIDSGAGPAKSASIPMISVECDDGTLGWFAAESFAWNSENATAFASNSTPDEHALIFEVPVTCSARGLMLRLGSVAATDDFEAILYSDPLGTPVAERTKASPRPIRCWRTRRMRLRSVRRRRTRSPIRN